MALARKILCILHHLLINREKYQEEGIEKSRPTKIDWSSLVRDKVDLQTLIEIIAKAGAEVRKIDSDGG